MKSNTIRNQIMGPAIAIISLILILAFFLLSDLQNKNIIRKNSFVIEHLNAFIQSEISEDQKTFVGLLELVKNDLVIQQAWKDKNRDALYLSTIDLYQSLHKSHRITHFYFHDLTKDIFLRVHAPHRHSDKINRYTLNQATTTRETISGIEIGTFGQIVFRVVSPWIIDGELVGYIEFGEEVEHILDKISLFLDIKIITLINKDKLNRTDWESRSATLKRHTSWDKFPNHVVVESTRIDNIEQFFTIFEYDLKEKELATIIKENNNYYFAGDLPLTNVKGEFVGHLVFINDVSQDIASTKRSTLILFFVGSIFSCILIILYFFYVGRIARFQHEILQKLTDEMQTKTLVEEELSV